MNEQVRVEIVPRTVKTDPDPIDVKRATLDLNQARETGNVDAIRAAQDAYVAVLDGEHTTVWSARINGTDFPLVAYGIEPDDGRVLVSLVVDASSVQIGDQSPAVSPEPAKPEPKTSTWGDPSLPDPRASIPGWSRPVSADVATNAPRTLDAIRQGATA